MILRLHSFLTGLLVLLLAVLLAFAPLGAEPASAGGAISGADLHNVVGRGIIGGHYAEGDLVHVSLHALVGCAMAELQGADCAAGAVGGAVSALYGGYLDRNGLAEDGRA